jgi:hypothetical protein
MDQRMVDLQSEAKEMIRDKVLRPLAESWGIEDFDDLNVEIHFQPSVRRLTMEDIQKLPTDCVSPIEKREILKTLHIPLDDSEFQKYIDSGEQDKILAGPKRAPVESPLGKPSQGQGKAESGQDNQQAPAPKPQGQQKQKPIKEHKLIKINEAMRDPSVLEAFIKQQVAKSLERITLSPQTSGSSDSFRSDSDDANPEITDDVIMDRILNTFDAGLEKPNEQEDTKAEPMQVSPIPAEGYPEEAERENNYPQPFEFNSQFDNDDDEAMQSDMDNSTPIETSKPQKTMAVPKQVPESRNERLRKYLNKGTDKDKLREFFNDN